MTGATALHVDPANAEQARAWDGDEGAYWTENADRFDKAVADYHERLLGAAAIGGADRVLDIGCGTGQTTRDAALSAADGVALGVDLSGQMIALARQLAAEQGISNARFEQADAQVHPFTAVAFDVAISRTGTMFFAEPDAAFANIARALRPGGRLAVVDFDAHEEEFLRADFAHRRLGFPLAEIEKYLADAGLVEVRSRRVPPEPGESGKLTVALWLAEDPRVISDSFPKSDLEYA